MHLLTLSADFSKMREFVIGVGNSANVSEHTACAQRNQVVQAGGSVKLECQAVGRFVSFGRNGTSAVVCEVAVIGFPVSGKSIYIKKSKKINPESAFRLPSWDFRGFLP
jgi:hypothetical protein